MKNPGRTLEIGANVSTAFVSQSPIAARPSSAEVKNFYHTGTGLYLANFVIFLSSLMTTPLLNLYPSASLKKYDLERRLERNLNDVNGFNNSIINMRAKITHFKDKLYKRKKIYNTCKTHISILDSVDTVVIIGATRTSVTLSITCVSLIVVPTSAGTACAQPLGKKVLH